MPARSLQRLLDDLAEQLADMTPGQYTARPAEHVSGSVGEHVRHVLDHVSAFLTIGRDETLSYDSRERGTAVETEPRAALSQIARLRSGLDELLTHELDEPVEVAAKVSASGELVTGWSTRARELAFVVSHTIHHQAIIALLLAFDGIGVPREFGYAPSTPRR